MKNNERKYDIISMQDADSFIPSAKGKIYDTFALLVKTLSDNKLTLSGAESCTGGLVSKLITDISGASAVFCGAVVSYSNEAKMNVLGVSLDTIEKYTEVSCEAAYEMAVGAKFRLKTDLAYSTTGYAGPTGGTDADPTGTVYVGIAFEKCISVYRLAFSRNRTREEIRSGTASFIAAKILENQGKNLSKL